MAEPSRVSKDKQAGTDRKHHIRQRDSRPVFEDIRTWDHDLITFNETPFRPPMDKHAAFLAAAPPGPSLTNFMQHLQRTYGNAYVQRLLKHSAVQAASAPTSAAGDDLAIDSGQHATGTVEMERPQPYEPAHVGRRDIDSRGRAYAAPVMREITPPYRAELERETIPGLKDDTVDKLKKMLEKPGREQEAIDTILKESGLKGGLSSVEGGTMKYDPKFNETCEKAAKSPEEKAKCGTLRGVTTKGVKIPSLKEVTRVRIGPGALKSVPVLYSTLYHEYVHVQQPLSINFGPGEAASEVEAYYFEIKKAGITGIAADTREIASDFLSLRREYLKLKGTEKKKYKKDYEWARDETLRLLLKNIKAEKDVEKLRSDTADARDFQDIVGSELPSKGNAELTALLQSKYKPLFLAEISRIKSMKRPEEFSAASYNLKMYYEGLADADKKSLRGRYLKALRTIFMRLVRSIMIMKPRPRSTSITPVLPDIDMMFKKMTLDSLYKDLPDELKSKLKPQYDRAQKHLEKIKG